MSAISMIFPESFNPPADPGSTVGRRPPPWILLDLDTYLADRRNATTATATATSRLGHTIQVSLHAADPPAMSYLCVHCPSSKPDDDPAFAFAPCVVGAEGRFVLLRVRFAHAGYDNDEYFMYKADQDSPSLENLRHSAIIDHRVPLVNKQLSPENLRRPAFGHRVPLTLKQFSLENLGRHVIAHRVPLFKQLAVVPLGDGGHYLLAGSFCMQKLHIYSSADQTWNIKPLPPSDAFPDGHSIFPDKVIPLGDGVVGWVDLRVGVAVCDLLREPLEVSRFIPLPEPMPTNRERWERNKEFRHGDPAWRFRDVAFCNGVLKFVETEHRWIVTTIGPAPEEPTDPSEKDVLHDSDLIMSRKRKAEDMNKPTQVWKRDGWRMVTWSRPAMASDCWHKGCVIDVDDIAVDDAITSSLRSAVGREEHDESFKFRNMVSGFPTLSTDVDDLVYLKATEKANDSKAWMVSVDLGKKRLTALGAYSFDRHDPCAYNFRVCSFSNYLNMDPADSSQTIKLKDSADTLKTRQSSAEEASMPHVHLRTKARDPLGRLMLELKAQEDHGSVREHGAESSEECKNSVSGSSGPLPPSAKRLPPRPVKLKL